MVYDCLIVEDEKLLAENTGKYLNLSGVHTAVLFCMEDCIPFVKEHTVRLILLDINLGDGCGYQLCRQLRSEFQMPILFISSIVEEESILLALSVGGDDYICKPYSLPVLLAKVKAVLKRLPKVEEVQEKKITFGNIEILLKDGSVIKDGKPLPLTHMEQKLLLYLIQNRNKLVGKEELFQKVWQEAYVGEGTLNVHIRRLREKLEVHPSSPEHIITEYGKGYIFTYDNRGES